MNINIKFKNIRNFKNAEINITNSDIIIVGQNDHGKSSILKILDVVFNKLEKSYFQNEHALPENIFTILNPAISPGNFAKRIILTKDYKETLYITIREASISVSKKETERKFESSTKDINALFSIITKVKFIYIPSFRDTSSETYLNLFQQLMDDKGLKEIIPKVVGGTRKEYRLLKSMRQQLQDEITPYLDQNLLPEIKKNLFLNIPYELKIAFNVNLEQMIKWINQSINLGIILQEKSEIISISEVGSGIQSLLLLAIQRLTNLSAQNPDINYYLAIEEPEAFLHPQVQRAITENIIKESQDKQNFNLILTTHSPYVLNRFSLEKIILIKKDSNHYTDIIIPEIDQKDSAILNDYNNEINSEIFFSDIVFFVEGNGDKRVILKLIQKYLNKHFHRISIIETGGNNTFSPYLKLIGTLKKSNIKYGIITDFDSVTKSTNRALFTGIKNSGIDLNKKKLDKLISEIDKQVGLSEHIHTELCRKASSLLKEHNINTFIFPSDLEYSICEDSIKSKISGLIKEHFQSDLSGFTIDQIRKKIGSKGIDLIKGQEEFKKPFIHEKIVDLYEKKEQFNSSISALINFISKICENKGT